MGPTEIILEHQLALKQIVEGTSTYTGRDFFDSLVMNLAETLDMQGAWVTEYLTGVEKTFILILSIAIFVNGVWLLVIVDRQYSTAVPTQGGSLNEGIVGSPHKINPLLAISLSQSFAVPSYEMTSSAMLEVLSKRLLSTLKFDTLPFIATHSEFPVLTSWK